MKPALLIVSVILLAFFMSNTANAAPAASSLDLSGIASVYSLSADQENRINALYAAMVARGMTAFQTRLMLSQIFLETGLLTDIANYRLMNQNNYAGLTDQNGQYSSFNSIDDFMDAYIGFLTKRSDPLGASSLADFNNRLLTIGPNGEPYYQSNPANYLAGLQAYYNLLS